MITRGLLLAAAALLLGLASMWTRAAEPPPACPGPALVFEPLAADLWLIAARGERADPDNRGQVAHLLLARHRGRLWLLGSGPSPDFGRRLDCQVRQLLGQPVAEVAIPRARAELALGSAGLRGARVWATPSVRAAMRLQCEGCVARLRERLGPAGAELGDAPVRLPTQRLRGHQGRWGPFEWRQEMLDTGIATTLWRHAGADVVAGFGVLWFGAPPDGRDADLARLARATASLLAGAGAATRFIPEQGPPGGRDEVGLQLAYWELLLREAAAGVARGDVQAAPPAPAVAAWSGHERHALNWQRAWRQAEDGFLAPPPKPGPR